jgi:hypothetical protein
LHDLAGFVVKVDVFVIAVAVTVKFAVKRPCRAVKPASQRAAVVVGSIPNVMGPSFVDSAAQPHFPFQMEHQGFGKFHGSILS